MGGRRARRERRQRLGQDRPGPNELNALERTFKSQLEKIRTSRTLTPEGQRLEANEARTAFRENWRKTRARVRDSLEEQIEEKRRQATPQPSDAVLERMGRLAAVKVPSWQRSPGQLLRDAEQFEIDGDEAGLRLVREHAGLVENIETRTQLAGGINEILLEDLGSDEQRQAAQDATKLERELSNFELSSTLRERGIISHMAQEQGPPPAAEPTGATYAQINAPRR